MVVVFTDTVEYPATLSPTTVDAVVVPEVPVMVTEVNAAGSDAADVKVITLEPVVGLVANAAVTPLGRPVAASVTLPVNPPKSSTVMVSVLLLPWSRVTGDEPASSVNPLPPLALPLPTALQVVPLIAKFVGIALVTPFQLALNPNSEVLPPAGIAPS